MTPTNWLTSHLHQGLSPRAAGYRGLPHKTDLVVSVDDAYPDYFTPHGPHHVAIKWFPMGEAGCVLPSLYGALVALEQARRSDLHVYLHCYAGLYRSRLVAECYAYLLDNTQAFPVDGAVRKAQQAGQLPLGDWVYVWLMRLDVYLEKGPLPSGLLTSLYLETGPRQYAPPFDEPTLTGPISLL
jgi:hypothetical protein